RRPRNLGFGSAATAEPDAMRKLLSPVLAVAVSWTVATACAQPPARLPEFDRRTPIVIAVENVGPAVVNIRAQARVQRSHFYFGLFQQQTDEDPTFADSSLGSGVVIHPDGFVVTNEHVTHGAERLLLKFKDGREVGATQVNASTDSDIALLKIDG